MVYFSSRISLFCINAVIKKHFKKTCAAVPAWPDIIKLLQITIFNASWSVIAGKTFTFESNLKRLETWMDWFLSLYITRRKNGLEIDVSLHLQYVIYFLQIMRYLFRRLVLTITLSGVMFGYLREDILFFDAKRVPFFWLRKWSLQVL